ncbi:MAG: exosortase-associated EpsI family protein [Verrucomicrobiota bacterium]
MKDKKRIFLWIGLALAITVSLLWEFAPSCTSSNSRLAALPSKGLGFSAQELPLNETEKQVYHNANVVKRLYQVGRQRFVLLAIDGSRDRHAVHDPLYCFRGAGWKVGTSLEVSVPGGEARWLKLARNSESAEAVIWFSDGTRRHASALRAWWQSTLRRLTLGRSGNEPVLVILQPTGSETVAWDNVFSRCPSLFEL